MTKAKPSRGVLTRDLFRDFARQVLRTLFGMLIVVAIFAFIYIILLGTVQFINIAAATGHLGHLLSELCYDHLGITLFFSLAVGYWIFCGCWRTVPEH